MSLPKTSVSLRSLLVGIVLMALVPTALLMTWHTGRRVDEQTRHLHEELGFAARMLAQQVGRELQTRGAAAAPEPGARWGELLTAALGPSQRHLSLYDGQRRRIAWAGPGPAAGALPQAAAAGRQVLDDGASYDVALAAVPGTDWLAAVELRAAVLDRLHQRIVVGALGWAALSLLLGAALALWAASRVGGPLRRLGVTPAGEGQLVIREIEQLREALAEAGGREAASRADLQRKADELDAVFQASPVGLALAQKRADGGLDISVNPAWQRLLGAQDGADGSTAALLNGSRQLPPHEAPLQRAAASGEVVNPMVLTVGTGLPARHVVMQAVPLRHAGGAPRGAIAVAMDVTEQYVAERERMEIGEREQQARHEAVAVNREKDELLETLSHELRNPLNAIAAAVEVLNLQDSDDPLQRDARMTITRQTHRLGRMLGDLLTTAAAVRGGVLRRAPTELSGVVWCAVDAAQRLAGDRASSSEQPVGVELHCEAVWVDADADLIERMATHLVAHALKHATAGTAVEVVSRREDACAVLQVRHRGAGVPAALQGGVADPLVQPAPAPPGGPGGPGLGLTLVKQLVQVHGGRLRASSAAGTSTWRVELPCIEAPPGAADAARATTHPLRAAAPRNVLLVEDHPDALRSLRTALEVEGHQVSAACDGRAGLRALLDLRPEVAIVDIGLPGLDGLQLARLGRSAGYAGQLVALSAYGRHADPQQVMRAGFDAHLDKPVDFARLRKLLAHAL